MSFSPPGLTQLLKSIEDGAVTPLASIREADERIESLDADIAAFVHRPGREALEAAARTGGPLAGVPLGVKDIFDTADMPTAYGSPIHAGFRPASDAALVAMARAQGGVVMGKTATTEFAFMRPAATRNPAAPGHTPGGSSSGSAAAVAAGMVAGAFGSQTAGSVIRPASFCGVAGFKPSFRLMPTVGMKTFAWTLDTVGLFARGVRDVALLADLVSGRDLRTSSPADLAALRIGFYRSAIDDRLEPAMVEAIETARRVLENAGASVLDVEETEILTAARGAQETIQLYEGSVALSHERRRHRNQLSERLAEALDEGAAFGATVYDEARRTARRARRGVASLFDRADILVAPSALGAAPSFVTSTGDPAMNRLWTATGNPCINVPGLSDASGLPLGLTVIARFGADAAALGAAAAVEDALAARTS